MSNVIATSKYEAVCPHCGKPSGVDITESVKATETQVVSFWVHPRYCHQCHNGFRAHFNTSSESLAFVKTTDYEIPVYDLLQIDGTEIYLVVESTVTITDMIYPVKTVEEVLAQREYWYNESRCPAYFFDEIHVVAERRNPFKNPETEDDLDTDPHGVFGWVETVRQDQAVTFEGGDIDLKNTFQHFGAVREGKSGFFLRES